MNTPNPALIPWYHAHQDRIERRLKEGKIILAHKEDDTFRGYVFTSSSAALLYAEENQWADDSYELILWPLGTNPAEFVMTPYY